MSKQLDNKEKLSKNLAAHLQDPEFCDVKIICSDGDIPASKTILGMNSQYFRSMFSASSNFEESQAGRVQLPYTKAVVEKVVLYLYTGEMSCEDLAFRPIIDLLELLDLMNLPEEHSTLMEYFKDKILEGKFALSECVDSLEFCLKQPGMESVGGSLLDYLGPSHLNILITPAKKKDYLEYFNLGEPQDGLLDKEVVRCYLEGPCFALTPDSVNIILNLVENDQHQEDMEITELEFMAAHHLGDRATDYGEMPPNKVVSSCPSHHSLLILNIAASILSHQGVPVQPLEGGAEDKKCQDY